MSSEISIEVTDFCREHWVPSTESPDAHMRLYTKLGSQGWLTADWPIEFGGQDWNRQQQLEFAITLSSFRCPAPPDSLTLGAPLLMNRTDLDEQENILLQISTHPHDWKLIPDHEADSLVLSGPDTEVMLVNPGHAAETISEHGSPLWLLYEWLLGLEHIQTMAEHWQEELTKDVSEMLVELDAARALFLRSSAITDRQLCIKAGLSRPQVFSTLFQMLGYYALLEPNPALSANEPVPFPQERFHLAQLRQLIDRNDMLQMDQLYEEISANE